MTMREGYTAFGLLVLAGAMAGAMPVQTAAAADLIPFAPHRAVYDLTMGGGSSAGSGVTGVTGRMVYELSGSACDGYTQNMRFVTVMTNQEGTETLSDLRNSSWEEADAKKLRFSTTQYQNDKLADTSQGDAARSKGATPVVGVDLVKPSKKRLSLPQDIYFPMQHASSLVQAAKSGVKLFAANLYDGSEQGEKYYLTNTVIGKKFEKTSTAAPASFKGADLLASVDSWPMSIGYFEAGKDNQDQTPAYELSFRYYENGVTSDLKIDYGEFSIRGQLKEVTMLPAGKCPSTKAAAR